MLIASALWTHGLLCLVFYIGVDGLIEIVEEQQCQNFRFRLTCRELDSHIAILEAWYTSTINYKPTNTFTGDLKLKTENDSELDQVYIYSSPKHDGVYETPNRTIVNSEVNDTRVSDFNDTEVMELVNMDEDCGVEVISRSYASWREGDRRRKTIERESSVNLRAPVSYRCTGVNHCSFILKEDYPPAAAWPSGGVYIKYACFDGSIEGQYAKKYGELISFSEQQALDCLHVGGCGGGWMINVMKAFANETGIETTESYPYEGRRGKCRESDDTMVAKVAGGIQLDIKEEDDLQVNLLKLGPLSVALDASDMTYYNGGILKPTECTDVADHAVLLVGYGVENGTKFWSIKNSWGVNWGEKGYIRLLRGVKACGIGEQDTFSIHYCNREVKLGVAGVDSEGYIRTPGYPNFYIGDECRWRLRADPEQKVRITFLDVSLRSIGPFETECKDYVIVQDLNGDSLLSSCEQVALPLRITSTTNAVDVTVEARSKGAYPKRGVLFHYKSMGCVTLPAPSDGYLVYRNEDVAHYMCNVHFVFVDTRQRARVIWCYDDNRWNDTVPLCVEEAASNTTRAGDNSNMPESGVIVDIVIPSLLIAALFIGNAFIVLIIYKYRKRKTDDIDDEFNTIPLNVNGNIHCAGNAV